MTREEHKEQIKEIYEEIWAFENKVFDPELKEINFRYCVFSTADSVKSYSAYHWYYFKDDELFRQDHHLAALVFLFFFKNYPGIFSTASNGIFGGFMSDDVKIVKEYYQIPFEQYVDSFVPGYFNIRLIRSIFANDLDQTQQLIKDYRKAVEKRLKSYYHFSTVFEGIIERDEIKINDAILELVKTKRYRQTLVTNKIYCYDALELAKMCSYFGFSITVDHPDFPLRLAKFEPLDHYQTKPYLENKEVFDKWVKFKYRESQSGLFRLWNKIVK